MTRLIYLHGFASGPGSKKAQYFLQRFAAIGLTLEIPDLTAGDFENLTITGQLEVLTKLAAGGEVHLIGSSLGGYLAALYASIHPEATRAVLLAPAFCFPRRWRQNLGDEKFDEWERSGFLPVFHYADQTQRRVSFNLIRDASRYEDYPDVRQPCLIYHGIHDDTVPVEYSRAFAAQRPNVELHAVDSGHELINVLEPMWLRVRDFLTQSGT
ncbi:MAG: YqiA/YcfP family alpha/beta fold hydrolase [Bryobacteraceae bacterium]|nr:YqiA/YcfP family alpha/beta fold hydrolase [Bryobacteraceae bacterium]